MSLLTIVQLVEELLYALRGAIDETLLGYLTLFNVICCGSIKIWISSSIDLNFKIKTHINAENKSGLVVQYLAITCAKWVSYSCVLAIIGHCLG